VLDTNERGGAGTGWTQMKKGRQGEMGSRSRCVRWVGLAGEVAFTVL
jgi:hypothetical protein